MLRPRPAEAFLPRAKEKQVGVLARVPLASGLLSGKMTRDTKFAADDHRVGDLELEGKDVRVAALDHGCLGYGCVRVRKRSRPTRDATDGVHPAYRDRRPARHPRLGRRRRSAYPVAPRDEREE